MNRFIINSDNTVTDTVTNLMWQRDCLPGEYTWYDAMELTSNLGGYSDWRLPTIKELLSLVDYEKFNPYIDTDVFPTTPSSSFWSSSPYAGNSDYAWLVGFDDGYDYYDVKYYYYQVRLVRNIK
jgi:hypothetical protein